MRLLSLKIEMSKGNVLEAKVSGRTKDSIGCVFDMLPAPVLKALRKLINKKIRERALD